MIGVYFSGTGNSKYCLEKFLDACGTEARTFSIESKEAAAQVENHSEIIVSYPVQFSNLPKIVKDFVTTHPAIWKNKKVFVIATMGLFSGDGSGVLARLLKRYGAQISGGLHLKMPDCIGDEKALKRTLEENRRLVKQAEEKIKESAQAYQRGMPTQEGLDFSHQLAGLFGQRLYFYRKTRNYTDKLKINAQKCVGCGKCVRLCPMHNIQLSDSIAHSGNRCTMCYRCVSRCPEQAITLLGKKVIEQCYIEKYL